MNRKSSVYSILLAVLFSFCLLPFEGWTACSPAPSGMVSWWGGDNNALDMVGTNHGTLIGETFAPGMVGQAFSFDGSSNIVSVSYSPSLDFTGGDFSIDAWVYPATVDPIGEGLVGRLASDNGSGWGFAIQGIAYGIAGKLNFFSNGDWVGKSEGTIATNTWTHVTVTRSGNSLTYYINGSPSGSFTNTNSTGSFNNGLSLVIGDMYPSWAESVWRFNGLIDEVEIFNRALSANEIAAIYNAGSAGKCRSCATVPPDLVSWWKAEDNADDTYGGYNGTLENGAGFALGRVGQAFSFDGVNDYVFVPDTLTIDGGTQATYMAWVYPRAAPTEEGDYFGVFGVGDSTLPVWSSQQCRVLYRKAAGSPVGTAKFYMDCGTDNLDPSAKGRWSAGDYAINSWHLVAGVFNGGALDIYVNGILDNGLEYNINPGTVINTNAYNYVWIGSLVSNDQSLANVTLNGLIDEVAIFNRTLGANEIAAIYNAGSAGICAVKTIYLPLILKN